MDYEDTVHTDMVKRLTDAIKAATTKPTTLKAEQTLAAYYEKEGIPFDYMEWFAYINPGPGGLSHPTQNSAIFVGMWEYYFTNRFWSDGIATGTQFQRAAFVIENATREAHIKTGGKGEAFDIMKPQLKAGLITRFFRGACWHPALFNYSINVEREMDFLDMLTYAAAARNSDTREFILLPRIESVVACFPKLPQDTSPGGLRGRRRRRAQHSQPPERMPESTGVHHRLDRVAHAHRRGSGYAGRGANICLRATQGRAHHRHHRSACSRPRPTPSAARTRTTPRSRASRPRPARISTARVSSSGNSPLKPSY